jgi:hypothetical protein
MPEEKPRKNRADNRANLIPISGPDDPRIVAVKKLREAKKKDLKNMLEIELNKSINGVTRMEGLIARLVSEGIRGNMRAIELVLAYIYGKPQNAVQENNDKPFVLELTDGNDSVTVSGDSMPQVIDVDDSEEIEEDLREEDEIN